MPLLMTSKSLREKSLSQKFTHYADAALEIQNFAMIGFGVLGGRVLSAKLPQHRKKILLGTGAAGLLLATVPRNEMLKMLGGGLVVSTLIGLVPTKK